MKTLAVVPLPTLLFIYCMYISSSSAIRSYDENPTCYGQVCPPGTSICRKNIKFALNKNNLDVRINCLDSSHQSVKEYHIEEEEFVHYDFAETNDHGPMNRGSYSTPYSYNGLSLPFFCILLVWWIFDLSLKLRH